jgi:hypothetical protein
MTDNDAGGVSTTFANGRTALVIHADASTRPGDLVERLGLTSTKAVIVVVGAGDSLGPDLVPRLAELFVRGLVAAAEATEAVVIDGGTESGVMAIVGHALAESGHRIALIGVAPSAKVSFPGRAAGADTVPLEPNHSQFVLAAGTDWGAETSTMFALADGLVERSANAVGAVVGGGPGARREVLEMVRRGWPVVVIAGTGGLADDIVAGVEGRHSPTVDQVDSELAEIVSSGAFDLIALDGDPAVFEGVLRRRLQRDQSLESAWLLQGGLNEGAKRSQAEFRRMQAAIVGLGIAATLLAVIEGTLAAHHVLDHHWIRDRVLRYLLILLPIAMTAAVAASARFRSGNKWVVLRGAAEAVKREIYCYRARVGPYGRAAQTPREVRLAERVGTIGSSVMKTDVNLSAVDAYTKPLPPQDSVAQGDDGFSLLNPDQYIQWRVRDQADWYKAKTVKLNKRLRRLRWAGIGFGGLGTFLAAVGLELWIALTTAVVAAVTTYLEYMQIESTLLHYNQASADLETIRRWWTALPETERRQPSNVSRLVEQSERVMHSESAGWVQDMHDAMTELRHQQDKIDDQAAAPTNDAATTQPSARPHPPRPRRPG